MVSQAAVEPYSGRVLILGSDTRSFLAVVRSLGRAGLEVHVAWCPLQSASLRSRYISAIHHIPYYVAENSAWVDSINELMNRYKFDLVLPCEDASLLPLQHWREKVARVEYIYLLSDEAFQITSNKERTYALAQELDIPLPRQVVVHTEDEIRAAIGEFRLPIFVKPFCSARSDDPRVKRSVVKIASAEDIQYSSQKALSDGAALVQQYFAGVGVGVETLCRNGEILVAFQHERVNEPLTGGGSSYRKSVQLNPEMLEATRLLMKATNYTGVCMVEFRFSPDSRRWVLLEMNGRFWGSLPLAVAAGVDFPRHLYEMLRQGKEHFNVTYRNDIYCRNWIIDLGFIRSGLRARKAISSRVSFVLGVLGTGAWNSIRLRERSDSLTMDDPGPAMDEVTTLGMRGLVKGLSGLWPARWYIRRRALRWVGKPKSVLFVCKGNICRSPFAEGYLKKLLPKLNVASAGLLPGVGHKPPSAAIEAAARREVDLSKHRSRVLSQEDISLSEVVLVFEVEQFRAVKRLARRCSTNRPRICLLGALDYQYPLEINDPFGQDVQVFEDAYVRIARVLDCMAACILGIGEKGDYKCSDSRYCESEGRL
jgi:protein-tyrosine-phosphatase/predicted ATP-grasp superfamily ATP-dependent carboligase